MTWPERAVGEKIRANGWPQPSPICEDGRRDFAPCSQLAAAVPTVCVPALVLIGAAPIAAAQPGPVPGPAPIPATHPVRVGLRLACPDIEVIFARGTDDSPGLGTPGSGVRRRAAAAGRRPDRQHLRGQLSRDLRLPGRRRRRRRRRRTASRRWSQQCPSTKLVLGGYSQGAAVVDMLAGVPPLGNKIGDIGSAAPLPASLLSQHRRGRGVRQPRDEVQQSAHQFGVRRQGDRPVQGRRPHLLGRPEPVRTQRLRVRRHGATGRELRRWTCLAAIRRYHVDLVTFDRLRRWLIASASRRSDRLRRASRACAVPHADWRPCDRIGRRTAPTSRWCSRAAPMRRRALASSAARSSTAARQGRRQVGRRLRGQLPRDVRLPRGGRAAPTTPAATSSTWSTPAPTPGWCWAGTRKARP